MANDFNISPEMINNFMDMLKNNNSNSENKDNDLKNTNSSDDSASSNSVNLGDILSHLSSNSSNNTSSNNNSIDFETIMKIKNIMETLNNKNDPSANLLYSLKPYLRKSKQAKLDQYANLLKISQVSNLFKNEKGDNN